MRVQTCVVIDAQSWVHTINTPLIGSFLLKTLSLLCFFHNADVRVCLSVAVKTFRVAQELWPQFPGNNFKVLSAWQEPLQSFELWYKVKSHGPYIFFPARESSLIRFITKCCLVTLLLASWNNSYELFYLSRCERLWASQVRFLFSTPYFYLYRSNCNSSVCSLVPSIHSLNVYSFNVSGNDLKNI